MTHITFIEHDGTVRAVHAEPGTTLMQAGRDQGVAGILGECGGCLTCGTCHGYVDAAWLSRLPQPSEDEMLTLSGLLHVEQNSRLTCQIVATPELDGLVLRLPASQM